MWTSDFAKVKGNSPSLCSVTWELFPNLQWRQNNMLTLSVSLGLTFLFRSPCIYSLCTVLMKAWKYFKVCTFILYTFCGHLIVFLSFTSENK